LSKQTNNIVANKICVVSKIGLGTGIFGKMAVKGLMFYITVKQQKCTQKKQDSQIFQSPGFSDELARGSC